VIKITSEQQNCRSKTTGASRRNTFNFVSTEQISHLHTSEQCRWYFSSVYKDKPYNSCSSPWPTRIFTTWAKQQTPIHQPSCDWVTTVEKPTTLKNDNIREKEHRHRKHIFQICKHQNLLKQWYLMREQICWLCE
jgi:hypothetical protein